VAVIDSGIDVAHPDLAGDIAGTFDAIGTGVPIPSSRHRDRGRHCRPWPAARRGAGCADSCGAGLCRHRPRRQRHHLRHHEGPGLGGAAWRARVINMSFAGPQDPGVTRRHCDGLRQERDHGRRRRQQGRQLAATVFPPPTATSLRLPPRTAKTQLPTFANRGPYVAVAAPGVDLILLAPNNSVQKNSGTSFSAAYGHGGRLR